MTATVDAEGFSTDEVAARLGGIDPLNVQRFVYDDVLVPSVRCLMGSRPGPGHRWSADDVVVIAACRRFTDDIGVRRWAVPFVRAALADGYRFVVLAPATRTAWPVRNAAEVVTVVRVRAAARPAVVFRVLDLGAIRAEVTADAHAGL